MNYGPDCPVDVEQPVMLHRWERLSFLHWSFEPSAVQRLLPDWLFVETYEGRAWVGLVPFFMRVSAADGTYVGHRTFARPTYGRTSETGRAARGSGSFRWTRNGSAQ